MFCYTTVFTPSPPVRRDDVMAQSLCSLPGRGVSGSGMMERHGFSVCFPWFLGFAKQMTFYV